MSSAVPVAYPNSPVLPQLNGVIVLNKPSGPSSAQCLNVIKRQGQKKIGHAGTLDPLASGVLLVLLGSATKISGHLQSGGHKIYSGVARLGIETDTWDTLGHVVRENSFAHVTATRLEEEIRNWLLQTSQLVPGYSAAKHHGQPLYRLARRNLPVPEKIKPIKIFEAGILDIRLPFVRFRVKCSSGSYIRSLAHSLGKRLGCGAALSALTREFSHPFGLEKAVNLSTLKADPLKIPQHLQSLQAALPDWQVVELTGEQARAARNGQALRLAGPDSSRAILTSNGAAVALAACEGDEGRKSWRITRGLWN